MVTTAKRVALNQSALFRLTSPARLAKILLVDRAELVRLLANQDNNYKVWQDRKTGRWIEEPKPELKRIHIRVARLLSQIETPAYLHSGVKLRSYITNASEHPAHLPSVKLDVKKFFPSARAAEVFHFFRDTLEYPDDVAGMMTCLLTFRGHLPTGGNASTILSFWAYKPMFDQIAVEAFARGCSFTLYVDDMTLTGRFANRQLMLVARRVVGSYRLRAHKAHHFAPGRPRVVTGVAMTRHGKRLPKRRQKLIADGWDQVNSAPTASAKLALLNVLVGRICEAAEVDASWRPRKREAVAFRRAVARSALTEIAIDSRS